MPKGPDDKKIKKILKILRGKGDGIWIRELARQANMPMATVYYYLCNFMQNDIEIRPAVFGGVEHKQMKIVKLKR